MHWEHANVQKSLSGNTLRNSTGVVYNAHRESVDPFFKLYALILVGNLWNFILETLSPL